MSKRRWRTYRCQTCCWYLNVTLITEVIFLFFCACKQVWSCCRTTVMGGLLESGLELLQLRSTLPQTGNLDERNSTNPCHCLELLHWINCEIELESKGQPRPHLLGLCPQLWILFWGSMEIWWQKIWERAPNKFDVFKFENVQEWTFEFESLMCVWGMRKKTA